MSIFLVLVPLGIIVPSLGFVNSEVGFGNLGVVRAECVGCFDVFAVGWLLLIVVGTVSSLDVVISSDDTVDVSSDDSSFNSGSSSDLGDSTVELLSEVQSEITVGKMRMYT